MVTSFSLSRVTSHLHLMVTSRFLRQGHKSPTPSYGQQLFPWTGSEVTHTFSWSLVVSIGRVTSHLLMASSCFLR